jgi:hypothetical protein
MELIGSKAALPSDQIMTQIDFGLERDLADKLAQSA